MLRKTVPPMVIFDAKNLNNARMKNEVPGSKSYLSYNGWINKELCEG